jgi:hypothetical protein
MSGLGWVYFDLLTQAAHMNRDRSRIDILGAAPDALEQLLAGKDLFGVPR